MDEECVQKFLVEFVRELAMEEGAKPTIGRKPESEAGDPSIYLNIKNGDTKS